MNLLKAIHNIKLDYVIYGLLIFMYGLGWDYANDETIDFWSIVGVLSYTMFVFLIFIRGQKKQPPAEGRLNAMSARSDMVGKIILAALLFGLLFYKLFDGLILT
ncbi:MAG: hypothetical protein Q8Q20_04120 [bacterium]|nr:hypothetical protein [bacterium]